MSGTSRLTRIVLIAISAMGATPTAWGWGCKGHEIVALVAEAHLTARARAMAFKILADGPINPALARYCKEQGLDPFVDSSTWADDERSVLPETGPWHFIDIPRGAPESSVSDYCPPATGCVTSALTKQLAILRDSGATAEARADALRFVIHFVGDIHQPLHDTTNNDRGGNCVPVAFFDRAPQETNPTQESYTPNLHEVWDSEIIRRFLDSQTPEQAASQLEATFRAQIPSWQSQPPNFTSWAWESHQLAEAIVYGRLPTKIAIEAPRPVARCTDDDHISTRMLALDEKLGAEYQDAADPVVREQLVKAGIRLAALLNSIWP
ncbi:MAG TPA: S1/P1 nuclease [Candidatus Acidoferrales bacterium]